MVFIYFAQCFSEHEEELPADGRTSIFSYSVVETPQVAAAAAARKNWQNHCAGSPVKLHKQEICMSGILSQ